MKPASTLWKPFLDASAGLLPVDRLFDGVPDIVFFVKDAGGRYMAVNDTLATRCGLASKDLALGRTARELFPEPLGGAFEKQDLFILAGGPPIRDHLELHLYPGGAAAGASPTRNPSRRHGGHRHLRDLARHPTPRHARTTTSARSPPPSTTSTITSTNPAPRHSRRRSPGMSVYQFDQRIRSLFHVTAGQYLVKSASTTPALARRRPRADRPHRPGQRLFRPVGLLAPVQAGGGHQPARLPPSIGRRPMKSCLSCRFFPRCQGWLPQMFSGMNNRLRFGSRSGINSPHHRCGRTGRRRRPAA
jgi:hypothetical protein